MRNGAMSGTMFGSRKRMQHVTLIESLLFGAGIWVVSRIIFVPCYKHIAGDFFMPAIRQSKIRRVL